MEVHPYQELEKWMLMVANQNFTDTHSKKEKEKKLHVELL